MRSHQRATPRVRPSIPSSLPVRLVSLCAIGLLAGPGSGFAQTPDTTVTLSGHVRQLESRAPIADAMIELAEEGRRVLTDAEGAFEIAGLAPGRHTLRIRKLGYGMLARAIQLTGDVVLDITLEPDPIVLEGLEVEVDRMARRRNAVPYSVRTIERRDLFQSSAPDAADFAVRRVGAYLTTCPDWGDRACIRWRGRSIRPRVYIDDRPVMGGLETLAMYRPHEFHLMEIYRRGRMIRAYTPRFMEAVAKGDRRLWPVLH